MPGLLNQSGLAKREAALTGFETGGSNGLLGRAGFQTSPELADAGIAENLRQSAIEASQAPLASVSQAPAATTASAAPINEFDSRGGSGQETAEPAPPNTGNISVAQGFANAMAFTNPVTAVAAVGLALANKKSLSITQQITNMISNLVGGDDADSSAPGKGGLGQQSGPRGTGKGANPGGGLGGGSSPGTGGKGQQSGPRGGGGEGGDGEGEGGGGCFPAGTPIVMGDGSTKPVELVGIGDMTRSGVVTATMQFMAQKQMFEYRGVTVSGCHAVREKGVWKRVVDTDEAEPLDDERLRTINRVYVFDTTEHRIHVGDVTFADYSEVDEDSVAWSDSFDALLDGLKAQDVASMGAR